MALKPETNKALRAVLGKVVYDDQQPDDLVPPIMAAIEPVLERAATQLQDAQVDTLLASVIGSIEVMIDVRKKLAPVYGLSPEQVEHEVGAFKMVIEAMQGAQVQIKEAREKRDAATT